MRKTILTTGGLAVFTLAGLSAHAEDLFKVDISNSGPVAPFSVNGKNVIDLVSDSLSAQGAFSALVAGTFDADLTYAGVPNALRYVVTGTPGNYTASLTSPFEPGLISQTFTAGDKDTLNQQVTDYLKKSGSSDYAKFLKAINERSPVGVMDGNPNSTTALLSQQSFAQYGMVPTETKEEQESPKQSTGAVGLGMLGDIGSIRADNNQRDFKGQSFSWSPMVPFRLSKGDPKQEGNGEPRGDRMQLEVAMPLNFSEIESSQIYRGGLQVGLPIRVVMPSKDRPWLWQLTPSVGSQVTVSLDYGAGGLMLNGGLTSYLSYRLGRWDFSMGNHFSDYESLSLDVSDYTLDPEISSQIVKNGLKIGRQLGQRWYVEAYGIDTELLGKAYIDRYFTVGGGFGYRFLGKSDAATKSKGYFMVGAYANLASRYDSANFQLGTGWKF